MCVWRCSPLVYREKGYQLGRFSSICVASFSTKQSNVKIKINLT